MSIPLPRLTPEDLRNAVLEMFDLAGQMLQLTRDVFLQYSRPTLDQVVALGRDLHLREKRLTDHVAMQIREYPWSLGTAEHLAFIPAALERIGDSVESLARCVNTIHQEGVPFSEQATTEVLGLFSRAASLVHRLTVVIRTGDRANLDVIREDGQKFQTFSDEAANGHQERLLRGTCVPRASSLFLALLDYFREIERYTRRMTLYLEKALAAT
ncbi:MAG TPA: PhoU domain-containing protein [Candidatus Acidoferrum sp.]|nr:PhoU domain-containing protein [Candidatus Acidoferrum sp.]